MTEHILVVEDEPQIARVLQLELQFEGYDVTIAHTGTDGLIAYREQPFDLVLLDIMLPEMNGLDVLKRIRTDERMTPVILLTAKNDTSDKVAGLDLGANDYITKPFEFEELLARIRTHLRFAQPKQATVTTISANGIVLNEAARDVTYNGKTVELTQREFDLLHHFLLNKNNVQTREQLLNAVWGFDYYGDTNVVDVYVRYLRQKLDPSSIQTVRGVGYVIKDERQ
ncbi:response regulator transcription factor [Caryophanon latum]|uniref:DNA-binding response regulator n=1 Tax=Caryophanon latum TaxID=33977 RepID=A0A1C0YX06_9BACL|nr:response regulator transcription factor [Caryophanon latum]OCS91640.1 DNA-binding response regulator [Caryophanon latum]